MKILFIWLLLFSTVIFHLTIQCGPKMQENYIKPLELSNDCFLPGNRYNDAVKNNYNHTETFKYLTELCTTTHRLMLFKCDKLIIPKDTVDHILSKVLIKANKIILRFMTMKFTKVNINRLQRCSIEAAFMWVFRNYVPTVLHIHTFTPIDFDISGIVRKLDELPSKYDSPFIYFFLSITDEGRQLLIAAPN